jgi:hypothetical protein
VPIRRRTTRSGARHVQTATAGGHTWRMWTSRICAVRHVVQSAIRRMRKRASVPLVLHCRHCQQAYRHVTGTLPDACPTCGQESDWSAVTVEHEPRVPFNLSRNDRKFLKSIRIDPEVNS